MRVDRAASLLAARSGERQFLNRCRRATIAGFTLLELLLVVAITVVIVGLAAPKYERSVQRAHETALHNDLRVIREAIQQFTLDNEVAPQTLDDLVAGGCLREVPTDPITHRKDWVSDTNSTLLNPDQTTTGVNNVHSAASSISPFELTTYNTW